MFLESPHVHVLVCTLQAFANLPNAENIAVAFKQLCAHVLTPAQHSGGLQRFQRRKEITRCAITTLQWNIEDTCIYSVRGAVLGGVPSYLPLAGGMYNNVYLNDMHRFELGSCLLLSRSSAAT